MEEVLPYVFILVAVVFSIVKQVREEAAKKAAGTPAVPMPEPWPQMPLEEEEEVVVVKPTRRNNSHTIGAMEGMASTKTAPTPTPKEAEEEASEFAINTPEEARRAIIYSEILQRKY